MFLSQMGVVEQMLGPCCKDNIAGPVRCSTAADKAAVPGAHLEQGLALAVQNRGSKAEVVDKPQSFDYTCDMQSHLLSGDPATLTTPDVDLADRFAALMQPE